MRIDCGKAGPDAKTRAEIVQGYSVQAQRLAEAGLAPLFYHASIVQLDGTLRLARLMALAMTWLPARIDLT